MGTPDKYRTELRKRDGTGTTSLRTGRTMFVSRDPVGMGVTPLVSPERTLFSTTGNRKGTGDGNHSDFRSSSPDCVHVFIGTISLLFRHCTRCKESVTVDGREDTRPS